MIVTTTPSVEGYQIAEYLGIVTGEAIMGANIVRDFFASVTDVIGGRSGAYESKLQGEHETLDTAAMSAEYLPAVHIVHEQDPAEALNFPASHAVQVVVLLLPL